MATRKRKNKPDPSSKLLESKLDLKSDSKSDSRLNPQSESGSESNTMATSIARQPVWVVLAVASGACAAINGVFAKLTTTSLTSNLSAHLANLLGLSADNNYVNVTLRGSFFGLNLLFNGIMWALFTAALTKGNSTTRVSIVNVSANFFLTAILGWMIFSEKLPLQWWLGAALLACGNVIIGRREEDDKSGDKPSGPVHLDHSTGGSLEGEALMSSQTDQGDLLELDESPQSHRKASREEARRLKTGEDIDAPL